MTRAMLLALWQGFRRDYVALLLALLLPLLFFTSMVKIEQGIEGKAMVENIRIGVIDLDQSEFSQRILQGLLDMPAINTIEIDRAWTAGEHPGTWLVTSKLTAIIILPIGLGQNVMEEEDEEANIQVIEDRANPVYRGVVVSVMDDALQQLAWSSSLQSRFSGFAQSTRPETNGISQRLRIDHRAAFQEQETTSGDIRASYSAAGLGIMFLLFAMAGGGATIIDEQDQGTLHRSLALGISPYHFVLVRWVFLTVLGVVQVTLMFLWGELLFNLGLFEDGRFTGFAAMTLATVMPAAALGLVFAVYSRSRLQLNGISTVVILLMSALGGSLFPRYLMSEQLQSLGWYTFNTWSLVGYQKVMWYGYAVSELTREILVLLGMWAVFLSAALIGARRWR
jgi:ABC-2 type transport system permease protein